MDRRRLRRFALGLLACGLAFALVVELAWVAGAPAALRSSLLPRLNRKPGVQRVEWAAIRAGWIPGRVHVEGLVIERRHATAEWTLALDAADADIALGALLRRELRVVRLRASGLAVRVRGLRDPAAEGPDRDPAVAAALEAASPPRLDWPAAAPSTAPRRRHPWTYRFDDAVIDDIRDAWISAYRFEGRARLVTRCRLRPREAPVLDLAQLDLIGGAVTVAGQPVLEDLEGVAEARTIGEPAPGRPAVEFVKHATARVRVKARAPRLTPEPFSLPSLRWLELQGGSASVDVDVSVADAALLPGSRFDVRVADLVVALPGRLARGTGSVLARVAGDAQPEAQVKITFDQFELAEIGKAPHATGRGLWLGLTTPVVDLRHPAERFRLVVEVPESTVTDLAAYAAHVPAAAQLVVHGGAATVSARLEATETDGHAEVHLAATRADVTWKGTRLRGDVRLDSKLESLQLLEGTFDIGGTTLALTDWSVARGGERSVSGWWGRFEVPEGHVAAKGPSLLTARVTGSLRDTRPVFELLGAAKPMLRLAKGVLVDEDVTIAARLDVRSDRLYARDIDMRGRRLTGRACLVEEPAGLRSIAWVDAGFLSAGIRVRPGDVGVRPFAGRGWWDEARGDCP